MDKTRDMKRGASRFSRPMKKQQQSGHKFFSGFDNVDFVSTEKSKKEKLKRLSSVVNRASSSNEECEMGCDLVSDKEVELNPQPHSMVNAGTSKRFKLPKKFFDDCNGVDHASVPRKLRSAMKKRNRESISPPLPNSKKLDHSIAGVESPNMDGVKKPKLNMKQGGSDRSPKQTVPGSITKDEEEVVETLYALAGMFPDNDMTHKNKLGSTSLEANPPALPEVKESPTPAFEDSAVTKQDLDSVCPARTTDAAPSSNVTRSPKETAEVDRLKETCVQEQPDVPYSKKFHMESDSSVPRVKLYSMMPSLAKSELSDEKLLCNSVNFRVLPELKLDTGLKQPTQLETPLLERKPDIALGARAIESQLAQQHMIMESRKNGVALWPGLSSTVSYGAGSHGSPSLPSAAKIPAWLDAALCASKPRSLETSTSTGKVSKFNIDRKSLKRCAAHVYISRLIRVLQMPESKDTMPLLPNLLRPQEGSNQGILMGVNEFNRVRNGLHGVISGSSIGNSTAERNLNEARSGILHQKRLQQDQPQAAPTSGLHTSQKQSFDFLSLSAGGGGVETSTNSFPRTGNGWEPLSQFQVPYLHSLAQHHTLMPLTMPYSRYTSSAYPDQHSAAASTQQVQLQLPSYLGSSFCSPHTSHTTLTKQQQQQQQQHHRFWAAQLAAQYRPTGTSTSITQFPSWQNGRQDSPSLVPCSQSIIPPSPSSLEVLGPNYTSIPQQQQQLMPITSSLPPARMKRHDHHLPAVCEEAGVGFRAGGALPLQLLCNERL